MRETLLGYLKDFELHSFFPPVALDEGLEHVGQGRVSRPHIGGRRADACVADERLGRCRAEFGLGPEGPVATCSCQAPNCSHVAALALLLCGGAQPPEQELESSGDEPSPKEEERLRRAERARSGLFRITSATRDHLLGRYEVSSPSGRTYTVALRTLDAPQNGCTCQDFATNLLGTCKHIEAVLSFLGSKRSLKRQLEALRQQGPRASYLYLAHEPTTQVRLRRAGNDLSAARFARRWFDGEGRLLGEGKDSGPELLAEAKRSEVEVPAEVERFTLRALEEAARSRRVEVIESEVRRAGPEQQGFSGRLYPYQVEGVAFLCGRGRALLADDMGLGKTAQAIAAMVRLFRKAEVARALIVCPASLKHQWANEIAHFASSLGTTVIGGGREQRRVQYCQAREVVITSYELLRADEKEVARLGPDLLVLDEAQRIKNWRTRTSDVVKRVPTRLAYVLTGTPLENRLDDLYSLMQVVDPHVLGPLWRFNQDFTQLDERGRVQGYRNLAELRARLKPHFLRRRKEEVLLQLPERIVSRLTVTLDERQRDIHDDAMGTVGRLLQVLSRRPLSPIEEKRLMSAFQRARMSCGAACMCDDKLEDHVSPKLEELERLLEEICVHGGHKVVVFSEWEKMQALAAEVATRLKVKHVRLHGGVPSQKRGALIEQFREDPACQIFFSTDAGGVGLNLQAADHVINLELPWNPAVLAQRIARVHRLGQKNVVNVVLMVAENCIESRMEATLEAKRGLFAATVGDDTTTDVIERTTLAGRLSTLLNASFAAPTGPIPGTPVEAPKVDLAQAVRERLGEGALEKLLRTRDGRLVGVVPDGSALPPAEAAGEVLLLHSQAAAALAAFGESSPLAGSEVVFERAAQPQPPDPEATRRGAQLAAAERKLKGARALSEQDLGAEALGLLRDALVLLCRAAAERDPGEEPAALLASVYGELVPRGALSAVEASALTRAGELARAFGMSAARPQAALVQEVAKDASALAERIRGQIHGLPPLVAVKA
jgi:hypothetical protein